MIHPNYWGKIAAGVLPLCKKTGRVLLTLRSQEVMEPGKWGIPGGRIMDGSWRQDRKTGVMTQEPVESPVDGGIREFVEETGYSGRIRLVPLLVYRDRLSGFAFHNFLGLVPREFSTAAAKRSWENDDARWLTIKEALAIEPKHFGLKALLADPRSLEVIMDHIGSSKTGAKQNPEAREIFWKEEVTSVPVDLMEQIRLSRFGVINGYTAWIVDGGFIRHNLEIEFALGGNHGRYSFIPYNEVWVEDTGNEQDVLATIMHEVIEVALMRQCGFSYNDAHEEASNREISIRTRLSEEMS